MNIYAQSGDKVVFAYPYNGTPFDQVNAKRLLIVDGVYTVDYCDVGPNGTKVRLKEVPRWGFNSVLFADYKAQVDPAEGGSIEK